MTILVIQIDPRCDVEHDVGYIPSFLDDANPRPAREQFDENYAFGGWRPQPGFTKADDRFVLCYPGDPPLRPIAVIPFRDEKIFIYPGAYVAIFQPDGSFEACRMD